MADCTNVFLRSFKLSCNLHVRVQIAKCNSKKLKIGLSKLNL